MKAATTCGLNWPNIIMAVGVVAVVVCVPFSALFKYNGTHAEGMITIETLARKLSD